MPAAASLGQSLAALALTMDDDSPGEAEQRRRNEEEEKVTTTTIEVPEGGETQTWVRNLGDGRVEAVVEGEEASLKIVRQKISDIFDGYIRQDETIPGEVTGEFGSFDIRL